MDFMFFGFWSVSFLFDFWLPNPIHVFATPIETLVLGSGELSAPSPSKKLRFIILVRNLYQKSRKKLDDRFWIQGWSVGFRYQKYDQNRDRTPFLDFWVFGFLDFRILDFLSFLDSWLPRPIQFFATPIQKLVLGCGKLSGPSPSKKLPFSVLVRNLF